MRKKLTTGKFVPALVAAALLAFAITGCDSPVNGGNDNDISIFKNGVPAQNFDLWVAPYGGEDALRSVQLGARIIPGTAYYQNASWSSSSAAATVSNSGYVTAVSAGTATITATTATGRTANVTVRVRGYEPDTEPGDPGELAGNLIILHAAAVLGGTGNNANRTFVELFNRSDADIDLDGLSLQYALGQGSNWNVIPLSGNIPAGHSFLILGIVGDAAARLQLPDTDADKLLPDFQLHNRAFRLALMEGVVPLTVHNPSDMSHDGTLDLRTLMPATGPSDAEVGTEIADGLIDLLGVINSRTDDRDVMHGAKGAPAYRISNQTSIRRANLDAPANNFNDFRGIRWGAPTASEPIAVADDQIAVFRPRNLTAGAWTPEFPEPNWTPDPPNSVAITGPGVAAGALTVTSGGPAVTLSAQFTPGGSDVAGVTFAWSVSPTGVLTYGAANANTFAITGEQEGSATVTLNVSGGRITGTLTASVDVTVKEPSPDDGTVFAAWSFPPTNFNAQSVAANSGTLSGGATLEFFYADGTTRGTLGHADRASVNVPNNNAGWWQPANLTGSLSVENSAGWVITINTTGYEDITFSAHQSSSNNGPRDFRLAYRIGDSGPWAVFEGEGTVTVQGDTGEMGQTFNNVSLPEAVNDQAVVQVRVWIASTAPRGTGSLTATGGNTSLNHIEFRGTSTDAGEPPIAAWNHTVAGARAYAGNWPATSGTLAMETNLEFFYANEHRATLGRNQEDRAAVNVPNNAGGWFPGTRPAEGTRVDVTVEESAGWVITLNTTGYEDIMFSAYQSSSNNGPKDFRLAYRIGRDGTWTVFGDAVTVTAQGDDGGSPQNPAPPSQTFDNVLLPSTVDNEAVVQVRVWITSNARRSDGVFHLDPAGGNTSMNYIVFTGTAIEQGAAR